MQRFLAFSKRFSYVELDRGGVILYANFGFQELLGEIDLTGVPFVDLLNEESRLAFLTITEGDFDSRKSTLFEILSYEGKAPIQIEAEVWRVPPHYESFSHSKEIGYVILGIDLPLRTSVFLDNPFLAIREWNQFLVSIPDIVFILDREFRFIYCNKSNLEEGLVLPPGEFLGKKILECFPLDFATRIEKSLILSARRKEIQHIEYTVPIKSVPQYFEAYCMMYSEDYYVCFVRNITNQKREKLEIQNDIQLARDLQYSTLPALESIRDDRLGVSIIYKPLSSICGDLYDFEKLSEDKFRFVIADAVGHGIQASLLTMAIRTELERVKMKGYISPGRLVTYLNRSFVSTFKSREVTSSVFVIDLDLSEKKVVYSGAGHPVQFYSLGKNSLELLQIRSPLIGMVPGFKYPDYEFSFGDSLDIFLFTDGVFEFVDQNGEIFNEEKLLDRVNLICHKFCNKGNKEFMLQELISSLIDTTKEGVFRDDLTFLHIYTE